MVTATDQLEYLLVQAGIRSRVEGRMTEVFTGVIRRGGSVAAIREELIAVTRAMVSEYGFAVATFAADWYNDMRLTSVIPGNYTATEYLDDFDERIDRTVRRAVGGLTGDNVDILGVANSIVAKASQYILDGARNTIVENTYRDPQATGWQRVPFGATCDFCLLLVGRGGVYKQTTVSFRSHHNCDCGATPSWNPNATEVPKIAYRASERMDKLRNRAAAGDKSAQQQLSAYRNRIAGYISDNQAEFAGLRQQYNLTPAPMPAI